MISPVHYPSPGDRYVLMPIPEGKTDLTDEDIEGARKFAAAQGHRLVRLLGKQENSDGSISVVWLTAEATTYDDSLHGVMAAVEAQADRCCPD